MAARKKQDEAQEELEGVTVTPEVDDDEAIEIPVSALRSAEVNFPQESAGKTAHEGFFAEVFERRTKTGKGAMGGGKELIPRREMTFVIDGACCSPDVFVDEEGEYLDLEIEMRSLSSAEEMRILKANVKTPENIAKELAKATIRRVTGTKLTDETRLWFWEALGQAGRSLIYLAYNQIAAPTDAALGKFERTQQHG